MKIDWTTHPANETHSKDLAAVTTIRNQVRYLIAVYVRPNQYKVLLDGNWYCEGPLLKNWPT